MRIILFISLPGLFILLQPLHTVGLSAETAEFVTGAVFSKQLNRPILVNRDYTPFRQVLNRLSEDRRIAIVLDRRIDPEKLVLVDIQAPFFDEGIGSLSSRIPSSVVVVADTIFVTTPEAAKTIRTRIALAELDLEKRIKPPLQRRLELSRKVVVTWEQLASPREILVEFARRFEVSIENPEVIPYDLWEQGTLAHADLMTGVMLIALQYDRELKWVNDGTVRLEPLASDPQLEQDHVFRGRTKKQIDELLQQRFSELNAKVLSDRVRFSGLVEQHEAVDVAMGIRSPRKPSASVVDTSLANRRFTLRMDNRPFSELVAVLEKQGIQFRMDAERLSTAGVDLNQRISLELETATIEKLLTDACTPLGLAYQIEGTRIELGIAPRPVPMK